MRACKYGTKIFKSGRQNWTVTFSLPVVTKNKNSWISHGRCIELYRKKKVELLGLIHHINSSANYCPVT
jgi:hypothetical protein